MGIMTRIRMILHLSAAVLVWRSRNVLLLLIRLQIMCGMPYDEEESNDYSDCAKRRRKYEAKVVDCDAFPEWLLHDCAWSMPAAP